MLNPPTFPDESLWPSTIPGEFTRGDWKHDEMSVFLQELADFALFPDIVQSPYRAGPEISFHPPEHETVTVPKSHYEALCRRALAVEESLKFAKKTLDFAHNRDMARIRVLQTIAEVRTLS